MNYRVSKLVDGNETNDYGVCSQDDLDLITRGYKKSTFDFDTHTTMYSKKNCKTVYIAEEIH